MSRCTLVTSIVLALAWAGIADAGGHCGGMMGGRMGGGMMGGGMMGGGMMGGGRSRGMMGGCCCMMGGGMQTSMQSQQYAMMTAMQQQYAMQMAAQQQQNALRAMQQNAAQQNAAQQNALRPVPQKQQNALRAVLHPRELNEQPKAAPRQVLAVDDDAVTEKTASNALKFVRTLLEVGKTDKATLKLQELIERYPTTAAAGTAQELLETIDP